ncbi:MAG: hypothetical protein R6U56_07310, partial [Opitutales bacterium]
MKYILQVFSIISLCLATATQTFGQAPATPPEGAEAPDQISQLAEVVGLSEAQEEEIRGIIAEIEPKIEALQA